MSDKPILDQVVHTAAPAAFFMPAALFPHPLTFALAGAFVGFVREISEGGAIVTRRQVASAFNRHSLLDIAFWTLGGFIAGLGTL